MNVRLFVSLGDEPSETRLETFEETEMEPLIIGVGVRRHRGGRRRRQTTPASRMMDAELDARDGILPLIERPFAAQDEFVDALLVVVRVRVRVLGVVGQECFSIARAVEPWQRDEEVFRAQATQEPCQFATKPLAEEDVQVALRRRIEDHQELAELVQMLKASVVQGDLDVLVRIVGEEGGERNRWHDADEIGGNNNDQHVRDVVAFSFAGIDLWVASFRVRQRVNEMEVQLQDHEKRDDANEKAVEEQNDTETVANGFAQIAQAGHPEDRRAWLGDVRVDMRREIERGHGCCFVEGLAAGHGMARVAEELRDQIGQRAAQADDQHDDRIATRTHLFTGKRKAYHYISINGKANRDPRMARIVIETGKEHVKVHGCVVPLSVSSPKVQCRRLTKSRERTCSMPSLWLMT